MPRTMRFGVWFILALALTVLSSLGPTAFGVSAVPPEAAVQTTTSHITASAFGLRHTTFVGGLNTLCSHCNSNWAGNVATGSAGTYRKAEVLLAVPSVTSSVGNGDQAAAWTGVGGYNNGNGGGVLVQAGVTVTKDSDGQTNQAWVEVAPALPPHFFPSSSCAMAVGDIMDVFVSSNLDNDGYDFFKITNTTNPLQCSMSCKVYTTVQHTDTCGYGISNDRKYNSDSASGECIMERRTGTNVAEWNPPGHVWLAAHCLVNGSAIGSFSHTWFKIVDIYNNELVTLGPLSSNGDFDYIWERRN